MKRVVVLLSLSIGLLVQVGISRAELALKDTDRVMFFGANATLPVSYGLQVETFLRVKYPDLKTPFWHWGRAIPCTLADARPRLADQLEAFKPTIVVISFGTEEGGLKPLSQKRFDAFREELSAVIGQCTKAGAKVVLLTPNCPEIKRKQILTKMGYDRIVDGFAQVMRDLAKQHKLGLVAWFPATAKLIAESGGGSDRDRLTTNGQHPTPIAHALAAELLLDNWGAEPHEVAVHIDWQSLEASTTSGSIGATRSGDSSVTVSLKDFPMPWVNPPPQPRIIRPWAGAHMCRFTFHVHNAPPGGILTSVRGGRATPWLGQMLEEGFDMSTIGPLLDVEAVKTLTNRIKGKNKILRRREKFVTNQRREPEFVEANSLYRQAIAAEVAAAEKFIVRTPRTMDLDLQIKLARPTKK